MEMFTIFLCIVIGHAFGDQQRAALGKDDLKAIEDARKGLPYYVKKAINLDQYLQSKNVQVPIRSGSSKEAETDEKPSSLVQVSHRTSGTNEVKNSGEKLHLETYKSRSRVKHTAQNTSSKQDATKFWSVPVRSSAIRYAGKYSSIKTGRSFRRNPLNAFRLGETNNVKVLDIPIPREQQARPVTIPHTVVAGTLVVRDSATRSLLDRPSEVLKSKIVIADDAEEVIAENYVESQIVPTNYNSAKKETAPLKRLPTNTQIILPTNKSMPKSIGWNLLDKFGEIFHATFTALEPYEALKKDELTSLESFLSDSDQSEDSVNVEASRFEETRKVTRTKRAAPKKKKKPKPKKKQKPKQKAVGKGKQRANKQRKPTGGNNPKSEKGFNDPPVTCNVKVQLNQAQINEFVNAHNEARRREKASNMLKVKWDPFVAKLAQQKASACEYGHSMFIDCKGRPIGQNLYANFFREGDVYPQLNLTNATFEWQIENLDWNYQTKTCAPGKVCGHWETMTGDAVQTIGCAAAKCPKMKIVDGNTYKGHAHYVVCNYYPFIQVFDAGEACTKCAKSAAKTPEKGWTCEDRLCVPCYPKKKAGCKSV